MVIEYQDESEESPTVIYSYYSGDQQDDDYVNPWLLAKPEDYYPL